MIRVCTPDGIGFQYDSRVRIATAEALYPDKKLMRTETECNGGRDSWADARKLYGLLRRNFAHGASAYLAWNMVLDARGLSTWAWQQNALITADSASQSVRLNGEYYVMRHFSQYVKPGAKRAITGGPWGDRIGFLNPEGSAVLAVGNPSGGDLPVRIAVAGRQTASMGVTLTAGSVDPFVVPAE